MKHHPYLKIIQKNVFTLFNLVNVILAAMVAFTGNYKNLLFIFIAIANTLISVINGFRAQKVIDKLKLVATQNPTILRNGQALQLPLEKVQKGDIAVLALGDQVLFDSLITEGTVEVNEAFITGEQDTIVKRPGDHLLSGSFITSGTAKAKVEKIGLDNSLNQIEQAAREVHTADSELFSILNKIVKYISYALIPIGALLLWARFRTEADAATAITSTVAGLINMIPEGLILLTSSVLALATIRLSRQNVLVQDLYSIETLARVDTLCIDKTGTLTTGQLKVVDIIPVASQKRLETALAAILSLLPADNATSRALHAKFHHGPAKGLKTQNAYELIPFSSDRKYSGVKNRDHTYLIGALEFLTSDPALLAQAPQTANRVLAVVETEEDLSKGVRSLARRGVAPAARGDGPAGRAPRETLLGFIILEDELRKDAKSIIRYFNHNDVAVKIISGDNSAAVKAIAEQVGVKSPAVYDFTAHKTHDYSEIVQNHNIFTRVTPIEKQELVKALKSQGHTVAMTGDGVNDILAMKEADCSIAIASGSDAARRSARLVLLDSNFASVPAIIAEGRQSINNLERSATLFLTKTVYASVLAVIFCIVPLTYPFIPIEMSLLNTLCIGLPGLILALEPNTDRVKNRFVANIKHYSVPTGLAISVAAVILSIVATVQDFPHTLLTTLSAILVFALNFTLLIRISRPLNKFRTLLLVALLAVFLLALLTPIFQPLFEFQYLF